MLKNYRIEYNFTGIYLLSFERSKERSKEKSPAGDKLPEIHSYWRQKFQLTDRQKSTAGRLKQEIFASRQYFEFLSAIYHRRVQKFEQIKT